MLGTLNGALEARQVKLAPEHVQCEVTGRNESRDGLPVLTGVHVHYRLQIPAGSRDTVDRALARHLDKCPTAASFKGAVTVSWTAEITDA
ncbi:MAG: OsmC family protein [Candidatus Eisenbacteria bacterium]